MRENRSEVNTIILASKFKKSNVSQVRNLLDRLNNLPVSHTAKEKSRDPTRYSMVWIGKYPSKRPRVKGFVPG